jgi:hypothetical protein
MDKLFKRLKDKQRSSKHKDKTKDRATRSHQKPEVNIGAPEGLAFLALLVTTIILFNLLCYK